MIGADILFPTVYIVIIANPHRPSSITNLSPHRYTEVPTYTPATALELFKHYLDGPTDKKAKQNVEALLSSTG